MKRLLLKEFQLAMHPAALLFLGLSFLMLVPNYPYYVTFFYTCLGIFFICLTGRENKDIYFTLLLPVNKKDVVKARIWMAVLLQLAQILLAVPAAVLRNYLIPEGNLVGIDANIAFFGLAFLLLGIFNLVFFPMYYRDTEKVGIPFIIATVAVSVYMILMETLVHIVPFMRDFLDTRDPDFLLYKLAVLLIGIVAYLVMTLVAYKKSAASFIKLDY